MSGARVGAGLVAIVVLVAAVWSLREATMTRSRPDGGGGEDRLVFSVRAQFEEMPGGKTLRQVSEAALTTCLLEVRATAAGPLRRVNDSTFSVLLSPGLGRSEEVQLRGCMEDWQVDHVLINVERVVE